MTQPNRNRGNREKRFQVYLEMKNGSTFPLGPVAPKDWCDRVCETINRKLVLGFKSPLGFTHAYIGEVQVIEGELAEVPFSPALFS